WIRGLRAKENRRVEVLVTDVRLRVKVGTGGGGGGGGEWFGQVVDGRHQWCGHRRAEPVIGARLELILAWKCCNKPESDQSGPADPPLLVSHTCVVKLLA